MSQGAGAPPSTVGTGAEKTVKEYVLKSAPSAATPQMFHVARFSAPNFDFTKLNQPTRNVLSLIAHILVLCELTLQQTCSGLKTSRSLLRKMARVWTARAAHLMLAEIVPKPVSRALATKDPERYRFAQHQCRMLTPAQACPMDAGGLSERTK